MPGVNDMTFNQLATTLNSIVRQATGINTITPTNRAEFVSVGTTDLNVVTDAIFQTLTNVIGRTILEESLGEELRVLYVAMTRAKEKLIMTGRVRGAEDKMEKWTAMAEKGGPLSYSALSGAEGYLEFYGNFS